MALVQNDSGPSIDARLGVKEKATIPPQDDSARKAGDWVLSASRQFAKLQWRDGSVSASHVRWPFDGRIYSAPTAGRALHQPCHAPWSHATPGAANQSIEFDCDSEEDVLLSLEIIRTTTIVVRGLARVLGGLTKEQKHLAANFLNTAMAGASYIYKSILRFHLLPLSRGQVRGTLELRSTAHLVAAALYELAAAFEHGSLFMQIFSVQGSAVECTLHRDMRPDPPPVLDELNVRMQIANGSIAARVDELEALLHTQSSSVSQISMWTEALLAMLLGVQADPIEELFERWVSFGKLWRVVEHAIVYADAHGVGVLDEAQRRQHACEHAGTIANAPAAADWASGSAGKT